MKKLTVVGKGAVGSLAVAHFLHYTDWDIEWIYDENIPTASVGEATNLLIPRALQEYFRTTSAELLDMNGTYKTGILKKNWSKKTYFNPFWISNAAMHFEASKLQDYIYDQVKSSSRVNIIIGHVDDPEKLDSDYVMMCVGSPKDTNKDEFEILKHIPVNSAYVTQCDWDAPKFDYSLTNAMQHGWVFGIPLQNRISIGYLYNDRITSLVEIEEDVKQVFKDYKLIPNDRTQLIHFESYYRKQNFGPKVVYNGNASFFIEPLEATSTGTALLINQLAFDLWTGALSSEACQEYYEQEINDIESMIVLHYLAGSVYKSKFWTKAKRLATLKIKKEFDNKTPWAQFVFDSLNGKYNRRSNDHKGTWIPSIYQINIKGLDLEQKIQKMGELL